MTEYTRPSQSGTCAPTGRRQRSTSAQRLSRRPDVLGCDCTDPWSHHCTPHPTERDRHAQLAALEHLAAEGLPGLGADLDVVRVFWREHPEHRDLAVHCAPPQN